MQCFKMIGGSKDLNSSGERSLSGRSQSKVPVLEDDDPAVSRELQLYVTEARGHQDKQYGSYSTCYKFVSSRIRRVRN